ncbi:hypothetical protein Hanom_Chr16g01425661 [Helianthus anomalus]
MNTSSDFPEPIYFWYRIFDVFGKPVPKPYRTRHFRYRYPFLGILDTSISIFNTCTGSVPVGTNTCWYRYRFGKVGTEFIPIPNTLHNKI